MRTVMIDLHNHTPYVPTDYHVPQATFEEVADAAVAAGVDILGVTDHFTLDGIPAIERAVDGRLLVLPGAEIKTSLGPDEAHLIALFDPADAGEAFAELMHVLGLCDPFPAADLAHLVVERDPVEVAIAVETLGGMCHLGHADRRFGDYRLLDSPAFLRLLRLAPLSAVEFVELDLAEVSPEQLGGLPCIWSSDAHSPAEMGRRATVLEMEELSFQGVRGALAAMRGSARSLEASAAQRPEPTSRPDTA